MRLAVLSNFTVFPIVNMLQKSFEIYTPNGFDTWQQQVYNSDSDLYSFAPDIIVVLLYFDTYETDTSIRVKQCGDSLKALADRCEHTPILVCADCGFVRVNSDKVFWLPINKIIRRYGEKEFYSRQHWYAEAEPYSMRGISEIYQMILNHIMALNFQQKKVLALDLDNTLYGGVIAEDGLAGIALANNGNGKQFKDAQRIIKEMQKKGVLLIAVSKNNAEDANLAFTHPDMILKHSDFVAEYFNWDLKSKNLHDCARKLNIGLDSFVFIDDSPVERAEVAQNAADVTVIDFDCESCYLPQLLNDVYENHFLCLKTVNEDLRKTEMYHNMIPLDIPNESVDEYLQGLKMKIDFQEAKTQEELQRLFQLMQKTNQFNNGIKISEQEFYRFVETDNNKIFLAKLTDINGDYGIIAGVMIQYQANVAEIKYMFMSCRAMSRKVEYELLARLKEKLMDDNINEISILYKETSKNLPFMNFVAGFPSKVTDLPQRLKMFKEAQK